MWKEVIEKEEWADATTTKRLTTPTPYQSRSTSNYLRWNQSVIWCLQFYPWVIAGWTTTCIEGVKLPTGTYEKQWVSVGSKNTWREMTYDKGIKRELWRKRLFKVLTAIATNCNTELALELDLRAWRQAWSQETAAALKWRGSQREDRITIVGWNLWLSLAWQ